MGQCMHQQPDNQVPVKGKEPPVMVVTNPADIPYNPNNLEPKFIETPNPDNFVIVPPESNVPETVVIEKSDAPRLATLEDKLVEEAEEESPLPPMKVENPNPQPGTITSKAFGQQPQDYYFKDLETATTNELKHMITQNQEYSFKQQRILFDGKELQNGLTLWEQGLRDGDKINIIKKRQFTVIAYSVHIFNSMTDQYEIIELPNAGNTLVKELKEIIQTKISVKVGKQKLFLVDQMLEDHQALKQYEIMDDAIISLSY